MESEENPEPIYFPSRVYYTPPRGRDHVDGRASEYRAIHVY